MKKIMFYVFMLLLLACNSNEYKAKKLIVNYIKMNIDDIDSYKPVEYSKLQADSTSIYVDEYYKVLSDSVQYLLQASNGEIILDTVDMPENTPEAINQKLKIYFDKKDKYEKNFKPKKYGWVMRHTYRTKVNNQQKLFKVYFKFDEGVNKILDKTELLFIF